MTTATEMIDQIRIGMCASVAQGAADTGLVLLQLSA